MHFLAILIGVVLGASAGGASPGLAGAIGGALIGSLLYSLAREKRRRDGLSRRLDRIERRWMQTPAETVEQPSPARVSIHEPKLSQERPEPTEPKKVASGEQVRPVKAPAPVVHESGPEPTSPDALEHAIAVARRWLTTGNVPVKVGVVISFFGVAFLLKYAVENSVIEIPIGLRYVGVGMLAAALMGVGWRMRETNRVYALSLQGGGIGVLFLVVFAAFRLHGLLPPAVAFVLLVALTAAAGYLAVRQDSRALAILATTGGFLAPWLASTGSGNHVALFSYYLVLNGAVLGVAWYRAWRELNIIGFAFTFGVGTLWGYEYYAPELFASTEPFLVLHFLFYTAIAVLFAFRSKPALRAYVDGTLVFGTPTIAFALQALMLRDTEYGLAISAAVVAGLYAALVAWLRRLHDERFDLLRQSFIALSVAFATIAVPLAVDDRWTAIAWALEGAALVWIGVRQNGTLARLSGAALVFAGSLMFVNFGWQSGSGIAVFNANVAGGLLIALASLTTSWLLHEDSNRQSWHTPLAWGLLAWGLLWWFGTGFEEIGDRLAGDDVLHTWLIFTSASIGLLAAVGKRLAWQPLQLTAYTFLPGLVLFGVMYLLQVDHFFAGVGASAWVLAFAVHLFFLHSRRGEDDVLEAPWHGVGAVFLTAVVAYEVYWQVDRAVLNEVWAGTAGFLVLAAAAFVLLRERQAEWWPMNGSNGVYTLAAMALTASYLFFVTLSCIADPGDPAPLPYLPILNPFDTMSIVGIALVAYGLKALPDDGPLSVRADSQGPVLLLSGSAFVLATLAIVRAVHHYVGVPWDGVALFDSEAVQTSLTIFWAAIGLGGMVFGTRSGRRDVWWAGVALMGVVVAKLMLIDLGNTGTVARIVSFLGVGLMLLVVGYFSPVPPKLAATDRRFVKSDL